MIEKVTRLKIVLPELAVLQFEDETGKSSIELSEDESRALLGELLDYFSFDCGKEAMLKEEVDPFEDDENDAIDDLLSAGDK
jgi:hypothetical protein